MKQEKTLEESIKEFQETMDRFGVTLANFLERQIEINDRVSKILKDLIPIYENEVKKIRSPR